ncbi:putative glucosyltransferase Lgt1 [Legionella rubrilucens]|uniref:Putative glucosyltransferase Lgt1 n=1 Tax=Legionella rubrilucens TaxID=458 RepID=A0A0W0XMW0_9GAMM|nr:glycosyltransferase family 88 protein [Legionella rubrilucens]KTD45915.1 putative glucosyltransferase Lgt1 [Legionella rubrilucens]
MAYQFNPHRHVKIWLSKDKDTFLNLENRVRLVRMRDINPNDEIHFVYDSQLLSSKALKELESFCSRYNIIAHDVRNEVIPHCETQEEKNLITIYNDEMSHLKKGGNPAVGSDILRWLKPVYELGTYTDFDVHVDTGKLPETIAVEKPLLLSVGSYALKGDIEAISINNDTIAVVDSQDALPHIQKIQKTIYKACSEQPKRGQGFIENYVAHVKSTLASLFSPLLADMLFDLDPNSKTLSTLASLSKGKTVLEVRQEIIRITADNLSFSNSVMPFHFFLSDEEIIAQAAKQQRAALKKQLGWISWLLLPGNQYKQIETLASIQDDNQFLTAVREQTRMIFLKSSVVYTSGPGALLSALFDLYNKKDAVNKEIAPFSFSFYGLDKAFISENSLPLHATAKMLAAKMQNTEIGKLNDLSWLEEGQNAVAVREQKIRETQSHLPQDFHDMHEKIEAHIKKIETDLIGCFGFYRHKERHAKIGALKSIAEKFKGHSFDAGAFRAAVTNYRTQDVSASLGKSKTKALIDELERLSQRANHYMLTDKDEKVHMASPALKH